MVADSETGAEPKLSFGQRVLLSLPRLRRGESRAEKSRPIGDWARQTFLKPEDPSTPARTKPAPLAVDELEETIRRADDKERAIGLIAGPLAAAIGFIVVHTLVVDDPPQHLKSGALDKLYVNPSLYDDVLLVLLGLSVLMIVFALMRKRLPLGIAIALYGVTIFNLHYWGFGVPFAICGAWYIVRAYRFHRDMRLATGDLASTSSKAVPRAPVAAKRYTPKSSPHKMRAKRAG